MDGVDKLTFEIGGRPLLAWTLGALARSREVGSIVVVTAQERCDQVAATPWLPDSVIAVVAGGAQRHDSVRAGFEALERHAPDPAGRRIVLVHDGARPVVDPGLIERVVRAADRHGAAIPVNPVTETVKRLDGDRIGATVDRTDLVTAQTPQAVRRAIWRAALADPMVVGADWTDEAALLEACRIPVHVVPGDPDNLKVTMPADLLRVAELLVPAGPEVRSGIGHDSHPFGPGEPLMLGGVPFEGVPRLVGHSDGDVALHAIADALLGAASLGDLGGQFPAGPETPAGIGSDRLVQGVVERLDRHGWVPRSVDLTIVAARPRLGDRLARMRAATAAALGLPIQAVSIKASTGNLDGPEGAGRSISALALATIERRP